MRGLSENFSILNRNPLFFRAAFRTDEQNCLKEHDFELILQFYTDKIQEKTQRPVSGHEKFLLEMYCQGSIYMTVQWVLGKIKSTPESMARSLVDAMPGELTETFKQLNLL